MSAARYRDERHFLKKLHRLNWGMIALICMVAGIGFAMLYSAAHGNAEPWMDKQIIRFAMGFVLMLAVGFLDIKYWARIAYPTYFVALILLVYVEFLGEIGMGAQRWIDLKFIQLQPSEIMKVALILALAKYFHSRPYEIIGHPFQLIIPVLMVLLPAGLVLKQPDLGTAGVLLMAAGGLLFLAGVRWWKFAIVIVLGLAALPVAWEGLHDYQKNRVLTFLNPESDILGAGYHITQSKIALGSGGISGKGYMLGSQSHLDFLPERHTDFIFTMFAEEFGLVGGMVLLSLYSMLVVYGFVISMRSRSQFGRLLAAGLSINLFLYFFVNTAMVTGLIPVVGVPLPLVSYGGTALITVMIGFGLILSVNLGRDSKLV